MGMKAKLVGTCCRSCLLIFLVVFFTCGKDDPGNPIGPLKTSYPEQDLSNTIIHYIRNRGSNRKVTGHGV